MLELLNSMVRLSAAVTVYGMQEVQTAVGSVDPAISVDKLRDMIDTMATAVTSKIDEKRRPTLESFSNLGRDVVDRTVGRTMDTLSDTLKVPSMSPRDIVQSTSDAVKSTSDWLSGIVKPATAAASEPKAAEEALAAS
jgi:hypothetical protein